MNFLRRQMSAHSDFGGKRFTGFFAGRFFYVTHHAGYEWNRRYTNQKNAAMGYVKQVENGCEVRFLRFRGAMCPLVWAPLFLLFYAIETAIFLYVGMWELYGIGALLIPLGILVAIFAFALPLETFFESLTEESEQGRQLLLSLLYDPRDPTANMDRKEIDT